LDLRTEAGPGSDLVGSQILHQFKGKEGARLKLLPVFAGRVNMQKVHSGQADGIRSDRQADRSF
jgi:hypothetical protein